MTNRLTAKIHDGRLGMSALHFMFLYINIEIEVCTQMVLSSEPNQRSGRKEEKAETLPTQPDINSLRLHPFCICFRPNADDIEIVRI